MSVPERSADMPGRPARDPGLQPERTALAWRRTAIAAAGVALVCSITAVRSGALAVAAVAVVIAGAIVGLSLLGPFHVRMAAEEDRPAPWSALTLLVVCICVVSVLGCALAVGGALSR
ncbi:DUF202 domain-containing protein [Agreia pratensis]|nr:DUF202 domain-containing protein [Agreia pratensis]